MIFFHTEFPTGQANGFSLNVEGILQCVFIKWTCFIRRRSFGNNNNRTLILLIIYLIEQVVLDIDN